jgi:hypothetical protein
MKWGALSLGVYMLIIVISFWFISPFISMECPSLAPFAATCWLSTFPGFVYQSFHRNQLLASPPFSGVLSASCPLCCMFLFSSLFIIQFFSFWGTGVSLPSGSMGIPCAAYLLTCWSVSPKQIWSWCLAVRETSCFLSVTWHGEAFYRLGVQGVGVLLLLSVFFLPRVAPASQQTFWFMKLMLSVSSL